MERPALLLDRADAHDCREGRHCPVAADAGEHVHRLEPSRKLRLLHHLAQDLEDGLAAEPRRQRRHDLPQLAVRRTEEGAQLDVLGGVVDRRDQRNEDQTQLRVRIAQRAHVGREQRLVCGRCCQARKHDVTEGMTVPIRSQKTIRQKVQEAYDVGRLEGGGGRDESVDLLISFPGCFFKKVENLPTGQLRFAHLEPFEPPPSTRRRSNVHALRAPGLGRGNDSKDRFRVSVISSALRHTAKAFAIPGQDLHDQRLRLVQ
jgi:hypothetical protein